jgi:hypothetical protein
MMNDEFKSMYQYFTIFVSFMIYESMYFITEFEFESCLYHLQI